MIEIIKAFPISPRVEIIQMINDLRPVAEITVASKFKEEILPAIIALKDSGFAVEAREVEQSTIYFVSKNFTLAEEAVNLLDDTGAVTDGKRFGELMGFPAKSIEAFVNNSDLLNDEEVEELIGFPNYFVNMRLSRSDREGGIQYLKNTYKVLLEQHPDIFMEGLPIGESLEDYKNKVSVFVNK